MFSSGGSKKVLSLNFEVHSLIFYILYIIFSSRNLVFQIHRKSHRLVLCLRLLGRGPWSMNTFLFSLLSNISKKFVNDRLADHFQKWHLFDFQYGLTTGFAWGNCMYGQGLYQHGACFSYLVVVVQSHTVTCVMVCGQEHYRNLSLDFLEMHVF